MTNNNTLNTALICGASGGLGSVLARELQNKGMVVCGTSRSVSANKEFEVPMIEMTVQDKHSVESAMAQAESKMGSLDVVVNCVNEMMVGSVEEVSVEELEDVYNTNIVGNATVVKSALPIMRKQGRGLIVAMSSMGGILAVPYLSAYTSSKKALEAYMEALHHELKHEKDINVAIMQPVAMNMARAGRTGSHLKLAKAALDDPNSFSHKVINLLAHDTANSPLKPEVVAEKIHALIKAPKRPLRTPMSKAKPIGLLSRLLSQNMMDRLIQRMIKDATKLDSGIAP